MMSQPVMPRLMVREKVLVVELFGIANSYTYQDFRQKITNGLDLIGVNYTLEEVDQIDTFISAELGSVPAVRIDGDRVFDLSGPDSEQSIADFFQFIVRSKMPRIMVPMDLSELSIQAAEYAHLMSHDIGCTTELLHVHQPVIDPHGGNVMDGEIAIAHRNQLDELSTRFNANSDLPGGVQTVSSRLEWGFVQSSILAQAKSSRLVVMGTHGRSAPIGRLLGSVASTIALKAHAPVLLIPPDAKYQRPQKLTVAFDTPLLKSHPMQQLRAFNAHFDAHIDFVHVQNKDNGDSDKLRDDLLTKLMDQNHLSFSFDIHHINGENSVSEQLDAYCQYAQPDILVVISERRSLFKSLFHASASRAVCLHAALPTLIIHDK